MIRGIRLSILLASVLSAVAVSQVYSHGGGGGGGGHGGGGGGHMGGGGGHMGGGGGHMGGGGGHMGGAYMGGSHMGGAHYGGGQYYGGAQHLGNSNMGGVPYHSGFNGQQNVIHSGTMQGMGTQHMGTQTFGGQNFGTQHLGATQHQLNSTFYQNHGVHNGTGSSANTNFISNHQGSQFLSHHSLGQNSGVNHNSGLLNHSQGNLNSNSSSQFLSQHQLSGASSVTTAHHGNFLAGQGAFSHNHTGLNNNFHANHSGLNSQYHHMGGQNWHHGNGNWNHGYGHGGYYGYGGYYGGYPYYGYGLGWGFGLGYGLGYGLGFGGLGFYGGYGLGYYGGYYGGYGLGYGLGYYGGYGGYGFNNYYYGLNGYGYGLGGYGYGLGNANYCGCLGYMPYCAYQPVGYGYVNTLSTYGPSSGYGAYAANNGYLASGLAYANPSQLSGLGVATATDAAPAVTPSTLAPNSEPDTVSGASSGMPTADEFARIGETAFKARDYKGAARAWRHGLVDDPQNGVLVLMLSQALFATQQFGESAGAAQAAIQTLPQDKWDVVIKNFRDLYGKGEDYTTQLRALEKLAREKADDPSLRFLLGYHYGFLGYPADAVKQLEKCIAIAPQDDVARKLLKVFGDKLPKRTEVPAEGQKPSADSVTLPTPGGDFVPPPLNAEPSSAGLKKGATDATSTSKP